MTEENRKHFWSEVCARAQMIH